jgi:hypothetical protein
MAENYDNNHIGSRPFFNLKIYYMTKLQKEIERLAIKAGYPHIKLDYYAYQAILKQAHKNIYR